MFRDLAVLRDVSVWFVNHSHEVAFLLMLLGCGCIFGLCLAVMKVQRRLVDALERRVAELEENEALISQKWPRLHS